MKEKKKLCSSCEELQQRVNRLEEELSIRVSGLDDLVLPEGWHAEGSYAHRPVREEGVEGVYIARVPGSTWFVTHYWHEETWLDDRGHQRCGSCRSKTIAEERFFRDAFAHASAFVSRLTAERKGEG